MPVFEPPVSAPLPAGNEEVTQLWEVLYESMGIFRQLDVSGQLATLCFVRMAALQELYDLMRERPGIPAGALLLDPENAPVENLPYQAQYVGARLTANMDEAQQRAEISSPATWRRGMPDVIELIVKRELTGEKWVRIRSRTPGFGHIYVRTLISETPDPARIELELLDPRWGIPAWDVLDYAAIEGVDWTDVDAGWESWEELEADVPDWETLADMLPDELPEP